MCFKETEALPIVHENYVSCLLKEEVKVSIDELGLFYSVDAIMAEAHELGGSTIVVDRATPKDEDMRYPSRVAQGGYGAYNAYITAATRYAALGAPTLYDHPASVYGRGYFGPPRGMGRKIFVGRLPQEASADDLRQYFSRFWPYLRCLCPKGKIICFSMFHLKLFKMPNPDNGCIILTRI
ncbi:uncharacterized protein LOC120111998 [Phoenix dactylifera]|uniref:Uncharacterized protein LOC120111998 n=1 Tax=Phoenix dactylifera TaxID=42345 RepID=A0A8B9AT18_PHODC|nr:uncharacterized protein LOC120111998 [Phoenix dactylifera]